MIVFADVNYTKFHSQRNSPVKLKYFFAVSCDSSETFPLSRHLLFNKARSVTQNKLYGCICSNVDDVTVLR